MSSLFRRETGEQATRHQDTGRLEEMNAHELLLDTNGAPIASFDQIRVLGKVFLDQKFDGVLPSTRPLPLTLFQQHELQGGGAIWGKIALGPDKESQFPVTVEVVYTPQGYDLRLHIVPIHFGALEVSQFGQHTDSLLALAAAAAVAPQFLFALEGGIETTQCSTKKAIVSNVTPDHGTPLAVTFDAFSQESRTLESAVSITQNNGLTIRQAAHLHGQAKPHAQRVAKAAAVSKIAAGIPVLQQLRSELPKHALFLPVQEDAYTGERSLLTVSQTLESAGVSATDLAFLAAALGFTAQVVGDSSREQTVERVLTPAHVDMPLQEIVVPR